MLPYEIASFIDGKRESNLTKLQLIQYVIEKFGSDFPNFSFTDWCNTVSEYIDAAPNFVDASYHTLSTSTPGKVDKPRPINTNPLSYMSFPGMFRLSFNNSYSIAKTNLIDLLKAAVSFIGPYFVESLKINCGACTLISHVRTYNNKNIQFPIGVYCYLYIKLSPEKIISILQEISSRLSINAVLKKGDATIFNFLNNDLPSQNTLCNVAHQDCSIQAVENPSNRQTPSNQTSYLPVPEKYRNLISNIRRSTMSGHKAPHKPILLLALIELVETHAVISNHFCFDENFNQTFTNVWARFNLANNYLCNAYSPFVSMSNDGFWHLHYRNGSQPPHKVASSAWLNKYVDYAFFDEALFELICIPEKRAALKRFIINRFRLKLY